MLRSHALPAAAAIVLAAAPSTVPAQTKPAAKPPAKPTAKPYALRGVELGITIDQFRLLPVVADDGETNLRTLCEGDADRAARTIDGASTNPPGITTCQWFGARGYYDSSLFVDLGAGKVFPAFEFLDDGGTKRLFRIRSLANSQYYTAVLDALTRGYGQPKVTTAPFKTVGGSSFTQTIARWDNGASEIVLTEPCQRVERYCLTYRHTALGRMFEAAAEKRAAAAAAEKL